MKNPIRIDHFLLRLIFGRKWREKLWMSKKDKVEIVGQLMTLSAKVLTETYGLHPIKISTSGFNPSVNPGFVKTEDGYLMLSRSSRLRCYNDIDYIENEKGIDDINYLYHLNPELQVISSTPLDESLLRELDPTVKHVISDTRIFYWRNQVWGIGAISRKIGAQEVAAQTLCRIENAKVVEVFFLDSPVGGRLEKNWIPIVEDDELRFIYSFTPINLLRFKDGAAHPEKKLNKIREHDVRGGTPLIEYGDYLLGLAHSAPNMWNGKRSYTHSFILFSKKLELLEVSEPFFLQRKGLEFAVGICKTTDGILISYGAADRSCQFLNIPDHVIERYLVL